MTELSTRYMGLRLSSPVVASSSPLTGALATLRALEDHGAAAVILPSLHEEVLRKEQDRFECLCGAGAECCHEVTGAYFPEQLTSFTGAESYLRLIGRAKEALSVPVIASICGATGDGWVALARRVAEAGADGVELNMSVTCLDLDQSGESVESRQEAMIRAVRQAVAVPLAAKVVFSFASFGNAARRFASAGADGLVLFHRPHHPDIDLAGLRWRHELPLPLPSPRDIRSSLTWLAQLHGETGASLGATGGVGSVDTLVKCILAGADAVMVASAATQEGPGVYAGLTEGLGAWLEARGFASVDEARGLLSRKRLEELGAGSSSVPAIPVPVVSDVEV